MFDCYSVRNVLLTAPLGYNPTDQINDLVWNLSKTEFERNASMESATPLENGDASNVIPISKSPKKHA